MIKKCQNCEKEFEVLLKEARRGYGKYCGRKCFGEWRSKNKKLKEPNVKCANCDKLFYKSESKKRASKSGLFFCERKCKDISQKIGGIKEIQPFHYDTTKHYRAICFKYHKKECIICKENLIVAVHHYDLNHHNNIPSNLVPLCPTHHGYIHSRYKMLIEEKINLYVSGFINTIYKQA